MWVDATLVDTSVRVYTSLMDDLTDDEIEEYYQTHLRGRAAGRPRNAQPTDWQAFKSYVREMVGTLEVTDTARRSPSPSCTARCRGSSLLACPGEVLIAACPPLLRQQYGFSWRMSDRIALDAGTAVASRVLPLVPRLVRHAPKSFLTA